MIRDRSSSIEPADTAAPQKKRRGDATIIGIMQHNFATDDDNALVENLTRRIEPPKTDLKL